MAQAVSDHHRAVRIAEAAGGGFSETMLQREIQRMDPAATRLARAHDLYAADTAPELPQAWPGRPDLRAPGGRHGSALDGARDLDCLTQAVYFEARGETPRGQAAVAQVVMNRLANPNFPKTVCGVVFQGAATHGCQFSFACDGAMRHGREAEAWDRARRIAERALSGVVLADVGAATHFHTLDVQPGWGPQMLRVAQVGLHVFYRPNPHMLASASATPPNPAAAQRVLASLPFGPASNLRLTGAVIEKASEASVQAVAPEPRTTAASADRAGEPAAARAPAEDDR